MDDFFARLALRLLGTDEELVRPWIAPRFAPVTEEPLTAGTLGVPISRPSSPAALPPRIDPPAHTSSGTGETSAEVETEQEGSAAPEPTDPARRSRSEERVAAGRASSTSVRITETTRGAEASERRLSSKVDVETSPPQVDARTATTNAPIDEATRSERLDSAGQTAGAEPSKAEAEMHATSRESGTEGTPNADRAPSAEEELQGLHSPPETPDVRAAAESERANRMAERVRAPGNRQGRAAAQTRRRPRGADVDAGDASVSVPKERSTGKNPNSVAKSAEPKREMPGEASEPRAARTPDQGVEASGAQRRSRARRPRSTAGEARSDGERRMLPSTTDVRDTTVGGRTDGPAEGIHDTDGRHERAAEGAARPPGAAAGKARNAEGAARPPAAAAGKARNAPGPSARIDAADRTLAEEPAGREGEARGAERRSRAGRPRSTVLEPRAEGERRVVPSTTDVVDATVGGRTDGPAERTHDTDGRRERAAERAARPPAAAAGEARNAPGPSERIDVRNAPGPSERIDAADRTLAEEPAEREVEARGAERRSRAGRPRSTVPERRAERERRVLPSPTDVVDATVGDAREAHASSEGLTITEQATAEARSDLSASPRTGVTDVRDRRDPATRRSVTDHVAVTGGSKVKSRTPGHALSDRGSGQTAAVEEAETAKPEPRAGARLPDPGNRRESDGDAEASPVPRATRDSNSSPARPDPAGRTSTKAQAGPKVGQRTSGDAPSSPSVNRSRPARLEQEPGNSPARQKHVGTGANGSARKTAHATAGDTSGTVGRPDPEITSDAVGAVPEMPPPPPAAIEARGEAETARSIKAPAAADAPGARQSPRTRRRTTPRTPAGGAEGIAQAPVTVHVGHVEVVERRPAPTEAPRETPRVSLDAYLRSRGRR